MIPNARSLCSCRRLVLSLQTPLTAVSCARSKCRSSLGLGPLDPMSLPERSCPARQFDADGCETWLARDNGAASPLPALSPPEIGYGATRRRR